MNQNFKKVENFKSTTLETILQDFRKLLTKTFSGCLPIWKIRTFYPANSLSSFYGTVKLHKSSEPLRGIATSYDSLVNNAEKYVNKLIKPLLEKCEFSLKNTKDFKQKFLEKSTNFDPKIHEVITIDIQQMYSNINVVRCVSFILEEIYSDPKKYFNFKDKNGKTFPAPKREDFKQFLIKILQKFSIVKTPIGVFEQRTGLSMGSSLSPTLSNIFVGNLEKKIVKKYIENKKIIFYSRFADDSCLIIKKAAVRSFMKEINNFDKSLNFTLNYMSENCITFLDMKIFINKSDVLDFKKYRK